MFTIDIWSTGDSLSITWWLVPVSGQWGGDGESRTHWPLGTMVSPDNRWGTEEMTNQASLSSMGKYLIRRGKMLCKLFQHSKHKIKQTFCYSLIHNGVKLWKLLAGYEKFYYQSKKVLFVHNLNVMRIIKCCNKWSCYFFSYWHLHQRLACI